MYDVQCLQDSEYEQLRDIGNFIYFDHHNKILSPDDIDYILKLLIDLDRHYVEGVSEKLSEQYQAGYDEGYMDGLYEN